MIHFDLPIELLSITKLNEYFEDNILVVNDSFKKEILKKSFNQKKLLTFKIMTKQQVEQFLLPDISKICKYIIYKDTKNYNLANEIFKNIKYRYYTNQIDIENKNIKQLDYFIDKLIDKNYIKANIIKNSKKLYSIDQNINYLNVSPINVCSNKAVVSSQLNIKEFIDIDEEVMYTLEEISNLLLNNYDINNIKVYAPDNYIAHFKLISNYYDIPIFHDSTYKIWIDKEVQQFINNIKEFGIKEVVSNVDTIISNPDIKIKIINLINTYVDFIDEEEFKEYFLKELNKIKIQNIIYDKVLKIERINNFSFDTGNKNFILGYNNIDFIKYKKDKNFLNDSVKKQLNIQTTVEENLKIEKKIIEILNFIIKDENHFVSYSKNIGKKTYLFNNIIDNEFINIKKVNVCKNTKRFSKSIDSYLYKKELNKKENYSIKTETFKYLEENLNLEQKKSIKFNMNSINDWHVEQFKNTQNLSSTLIENYYKCNFLFYLENILKLKQYPKNILSLHIGTYIHQILDDIVNENMQSEYKEDQLKVLIEEYSQKLLNNNPNLFKTINHSKKQYVIFKINEYLPILINTILEQVNNEKFKIFKTEDDISFTYKDYNFIGKIDKVLKDDNNNFMVIDYKSGNPELDFKDELLKNGINLQNLIYFMLLKQKYETIKFAGTYRYKVVPKISNDNIKKNLKRYGYTNPNIDVISKINIENYKNLSIKLSGDFSSHSKILDDEQFNEKINIVMESINNFINNLENEKVFIAKPLKYKDKDICKYCPYINVCYKDANSANNIKL